MKRTYLQGKDLYLRRRSLGLSQREVARRAGVHHRTVQYHEAKVFVDTASSAVQALAYVLGWRRMLVIQSRARHGVLSVSWSIRRSRAGDKLYERVMRIQNETLPSLCCARTRAGGICKMKVASGRKRCRLHGGLSTGPKTPEGRARISEAQRRRWAERVTQAADGNEN